MTEQLVEHDGTRDDDGDDSASFDAFAVDDASPEGAARPQTGRSDDILSRIGRRIVRRPRDWLDAPWPTSRVVRYITALVMVGGATLAVLNVVQPQLIIRNNTPTGGDMGAHVMGPAYLRDHLLPHLQLSGWSNYWYAGFPLYRFYMVVPALFIVLLNIIVPYGIAFKVIAVSGLVTLPFCCWAFGRLARFAYPIPELMALAAIVFLFDESFSIYGGNVKSTMAGEFSFSIALSFGILGLGLLARGLENGKYRSWAAIVLALSFLSHGIVLLVMLPAAGLLCLVWMDRTRLKYSVSVIGGAILLSAFWVVPFLTNHAYMTDMKYGFRPNGGGDSFWDMFFPWPTFLDLVVCGFAIIGFVASLVKRNLTGAWLGIVCVGLMAATYLTRDSLPVIGLLWNPRLLPFLYLFRLLLMMIGIVETAQFFHRALRAMNGKPLLDKHTLVVGAATAALVGTFVLVAELFLFQVMPGAHYSVKDGKNVYSWGIGGVDLVSLTPTATDALSDGWSSYNFQGYEGKPAYGEYKALVDTMAGLGKGSDEDGLGCGRALWENNGKNGGYGTTMALMLLPHWTDGCITSMEGLFFEASGTTPYHFLTAAAMSSQSSNPVRGLRYTNHDAAIGLPYMQTLGVKYLMVFTDEAKRNAAGQEGLTYEKSSGPWDIYRVDYATRDEDLVQPLTVQPVVVNKRSGDPRERNLELGTSWFQHRDEWAAMPADDGPKEWQRIDVAVDPSRHVDNQVDIVVPQEPIQVTNLPANTVTNVDLGEQELSFDVTQVGVPVLVKMSYFPNWQVDGAKGPYRIAPNLMVVVPTSTHVHLHYERDTIDYLSYLLTFAGIILLIFMRRRGDVVHANTHPLLPAATTEVMAPAPVWATSGSATTGSDDDVGPPDLDPTLPLADVPIDQFDDPWRPQTDSV